MDPLTHYMFAYSLGRKWNLQRPQLKALTFAMLMPDLDVLSILFGFEFFVEFHGTITHSIAVALLLALVLSLILFLYYRKNVVIYAIIGVSMHLLFDFIPTLWPRWGHVGMILLYPFSTNEITLQGIVPYSLLIGVVSVILLTMLSLYALLFFMKKNEYPWRIWIDERKVINLLTGQGRNR
jgi:hypothetical protein